MKLGLAATALILAFVAAPARSAPDRDPFAGPLEVLVNAEGPARQGEFAGVSFAFENDAADAGVQVHVDEVAVRWADGSTFELSGFGERHFTLDPLSGQVFFLAMVVPPDAPLGTATFSVRAHVSRVSHAEDVSTDPSFPEYRLHGGVGHRAFRGDSHAADQDTFTVVP